MATKADDGSSRISRVSATAPFELEDDRMTDYDGAASPHEDLALAPGEPLALMSKEAFGLAVQYGARGLLVAGISSTGASIFGNYLNVDQSQLQAFYVDMTLCWAFRVFFGVISDSIPIFGYRRKSYMLIGWSITFICLVIMACIPLGRPYCSDPARCALAMKLGGVHSVDFGDTFDVSAPSRGLPFIVLTVFLSLGCVLATSASDALLVQYARREPISIRGRTQCALYAVRGLGQMAAYAFPALLLNGPSYQGPFSFEIQPNVVYIALSIPAAIAVLNTFYAIVEYPTPPIPAGVYFQGLWELVQKRVTWQLIVFSSLVQAFSSVYPTVSLPGTADISPLAAAVFSIANSLVFSLVLVGVAFYGLHWNWRWAIAISLVASLALNSVVSFLVIWDATRNGWITYSLSMVNVIPNAVGFVVEFFCVIEIAEMGNEAAIFGLFATISSIMPSFMAIWVAWVDSAFDVGYEQVAKDTPEVRMNITYVYVISYGVQLVTLAFLFLLPPQKNSVQELKRYGGSQPKAAVATLVVVFGCLVVCVVSNLLSIFSKTWCLRIAGGQGC
ncbi:Aste57867_24981 [Aphanomyces stellatus]|uniref:Aste57867_24981 protein n=1 Tax=Aphanomyces stellatus TaxID=120398 RepID=A0A485LRX0_9STRA|nr:hypothetical protein As57867_024903 [Aphanomyces stellatus]VFU01612.1 Aste57867_24981 [Aphanomyces stellatus]